MDNNDKLLKILTLTGKEFYEKYTPLLLAGKLTQRQYKWMVDARRNFKDTGEIINLKGEKI
jgi:hypothetical protein